MIALPPWKAEYLEKKRRKEKIEEQVPLWKRELIKRIHSKNQRMSEDETDIVEEHIPKVSDSIFLIHEKKHRSVPAPRTKPKSEAQVTSLKPSVSVDNVVIIEKTNDAELKSQNHNEIFPKEEEAEEYPTVGIVHRLMGRFQRDKSATKKPLQHTPPYQKSKSSVETHAVMEKPTVMTPTPESMPDLVTAPVTKAADPGTNLRTSLPSNEYMAPLLLSSAKPFVRHPVSNSQDHGYHHVSPPIRKVSAPTSPKSFTPNMKPENVESEASSVKQNNESYASAFSKDLSNLHSNREVPSSPLKPAGHQNKSDHMNISAGKHVELVNGDSLHSSGNAGAGPPEIPTSKPKLQDKSNFTSYDAIQNTRNAEISQKPPPVERNKARPVQQASSNIKGMMAQKQDHKSPEMKENRDQFLLPKAEKKRNNAFKELLNEPPEEYHGDNPALAAAILLKNTCKTFRITPSRAQNRSEPMPPKYGIEAKTSIPVTVEQSVPVTITKNELKKPPAAKKDELPSTCIDDMAISNEDNLIKEKNNNVEKQDIIPSPVTVISTTIDIDSNREKIEPATTDRTPVSTKATTFQSGPILGTKSAKVGLGSKKGGFGNTFVIDPSKFRKSSAAPQASNQTASIIVKESANTRVIVPKRNLETGGDDSVAKEPKVGKRKLTVDQITVIGGYVILGRSCLTKANKGKKEGVMITFSEDKLETTHTYISERSMLAEDDLQLPVKTVQKTPGFGKDSTIGKYTPKYLLSMKDNIPDEEEVGEAKNKSENSNNNNDMSTPSNGTVTVDATPLSDDSAVAWSDTTSNSTDILF